MSKTVIFISGKRTAGKDTAAALINKYLMNLNDNNKNFIGSVALAFPTKVRYCKQNNLDLQRMVTDYIFKEQHRNQLLEYFIKNKDLRADVEFITDYIQKNDFDYVIIPDLRMLGHLEEFQKFNSDNNNNNIFRCIYIRINASDEVKKQRGWIKKPCDDDPTETELDDYDKFDIVIDNNGTQDKLNEAIIAFLKTQIK